MECILFNSKESKEAKYALYSDPGWFNEKPTQSWRGLWEILGVLSPGQTVLITIATKNVSLSPEEIPRCANNIKSLSLNPYIYLTSAALPMGEDTAMELRKWIRVGNAVQAKGIIVAIPNTGRKETFYVNIVNVLDIVSPECPIIIQCPECNDREIIRTHDECLGLVKKLNTEQVKMGVDMLNVLRSGYDGERYLKSLASRREYVSVIREYGVPKWISEMSVPHEQMPNIIRISGRMWLNM